MKNVTVPDKTTTLIAVALGTLLITINASALNVALPRIGIDLSMDAVSLGWLSTGYILTSVALLIPFGRIADIYGRKKIFTWGIIVFVVTAILQTVASSGIMLITLRVIQGIGGALVNSTNIAILSSAFPTGEKGKALGVQATAIYAGFSLGPFLGGILTQYFTWRSIFSMLIVIGLFVLMLIYWKLKGDWVEGKGERFDIAGSILYGLTLVTLVYGFTHLPNMLGIWLVLAGILTLIAFIILEMRIKNPILEISLFLKSRIFAFSCFAALVNYGAIYGISFLLSLYLQYIKGFDPQTAGLILIINPVVQVILSIYAGKLSDRLPANKIAAAGMTLSTIGLALFIFLGKDSDILQVIAGLILTGLGVAFFAAPNTNALMNSVEKKFFGIASATITTMRQLGMILSMSIVMLLFTFYMGSNQVTPEYHEPFLQSVTTVFIIFTVLCVLGILASLAASKPGISNQT